MFQPRTYRVSTGSDDLVAFEIMVAETDLQILASRQLVAEAETIVRSVRGELECYLLAHPRYGESYTPVPVEDDAPPLVRAMAIAAESANVGPMAAVAGAIAEAVARGLSAFSAEVIVENGGDVYLCGSRDRILGLWTGDAGAPGMGIAVAGSSLPLAVATSSGRIGHSASFGDADTVTVTSRSGALADAVATAVANRVRSADDVAAAIESARAVDGVLGVVISIDGSIGAWGDVSLVPVGIE